MEAVYYAARANLRRLLRQYPSWTRPQYAQAVGMSVGWVKKWIKRLREALPEDEAVLHSQSRARTHPPERISQVVVDRLVEMRDQPPEGLGRTPGPKALLYYLPRDADLVSSGERLPRSSRTIYRILREAGRICGRPHHQELCERPAPMRQWQVDFKDASTVPREAEGKQQHVVEVLNTIDMGTSILVAAQVGGDFTAQTTLQAVAELLRTQGRPQVLTFDRDTRFVSSPQGSDFPSALVRFCYCLGVAVRLCDPHSPQQNGFVERSHRTYQEECLAVQRPHSLEQVREVTAQFKQHYNFERPHQGLSCGNRRPRSAFPNLPDLPALPEVVNPDRWLDSCDGRPTRRLAPLGQRTRLDRHPGHPGAQNPAAQRTLRRGPALRALCGVHDGSSPRRAALAHGPTTPCSPWPFLLPLGYDVGKQERLRCE